MPEILQRELPRVHVELGNWWSVTPGSQILWTTAANNVLKGERYRDVTDDLKNLMLGRYGEFPFYRPSDEIYSSVFGSDWKKIVDLEYGFQKVEDIDLQVEQKVLEHRLGRAATEDELVLYLQHPNDAVDFFKFEAKFGKTWVLPPMIWFKKGGFNLGDKFEVLDAFGKLHIIEIGTQRKTKTGDAVTYMLIDHHSQPILTELEFEGSKEKRKVQLTAKEIDALALSGDIRSHITGTVNEIPLSEGDEVSTGQLLVVLEAMKMLNNVVSEVNGRVSEIFVSPGDKIEVGTPLLIIKNE
ncbi:MAG: 2-oxoglutarate carboxylase large subunit [Syntrophus sp. PtaB.Bin001]|nr:MAG: 2-oxoglutarate carboxylase large subunit [Syntrophus sp. PtaB.Bin001]